MKTIWKTLKIVVITIVSIVLLLVISTAIFMYTQPQFGQAPKGADLERIKQSPHYAEDGFINLIETKMGSFGEMMGTMPDFLFGKGGKPDHPLPVKFGENNIEPADNLCHVTWYGHSAFLIEMDGQRILIDPMLGPSTSPTPFGGSRFPYEKPIPIDELTDIDAIIISHDHYDHLDHPTILKLMDHTDHFYTALGVGSHLKYWGVPEEKITELDWWSESNQEGIRLVACPARHFSGRGISDRNKTQWASWVIEGKHQKLYFSGDGGYGPHFKEIGEKEGPFDFAMMECGQYNKAWEAIHMMPEQSVQAGMDVGGQVLMPIHWGAFELSVHTWTDPIDRFKAEAQRLNAKMVHPVIGERFAVGMDLPISEWWK